MHPTQSSSTMRGNVVSRRWTCRALERCISGGFAAACHFSFSDGVPDRNLEIQGTANACLIVATCGSDRFNKKTLSSCEVTSRSPHQNLVSSNRTTPCGSIASPRASCDDGSRSDWLFIRTLFTGFFSPHESFHFRL